MNRFANWLRRGRVWLTAVAATLMILATASVAHAAASTAAQYRNANGSQSPAAVQLCPNPDGTNTTVACSSVISGTVTVTPGTGSPTVGGALIGTSSVQLLASGTRVYVSVQNVSAAATVACRWGGTAILNDINSFMIGPMGSKTYEGSFVPSGVALNCISDTASTPVYAEVK